MHDCSFSLNVVMAWGVCILGEGVGEKAGISQSYSAVVITAAEQIKVFPYNVTSHTIISWDRDKLRRCGSIDGGLEVGEGVPLGQDCCGCVHFPKSLIASVRA